MIAVIVVQEKKLKNVVAKIAITKHLNGIKIVGSVRSSQIITNYFNSA
jgi:hypothetical protein